VVKVAGVKWVVRKGFEPVVLKVRFAENKAEKSPQSASRGLIKDSSVRHIYRTSIPYANGHLSLVVKIYKDRGLIHRLKYLLRLPKGIAEYLKARELEERGVPTLFALAGGARSRHLISTEHYFISQEIAGGRPLHEFIYEDYLKLNPEERLACKRKLIPALASFVKDLHQRGVLHSDFHLGNIIFTRSTSGNFNFFVVDLLAVRLKKRLRVAQRLNNLALLDAIFKRFFSVADRFRFLKLYAQGSPEIEHHLKKYARIIDKEALRLKSHHRRKRLKRAFSSNRYFEKVKGGRLKGLLRREFKGALSPFIQNPAVFFDPDKANLLKVGQRATVAEGKITADGKVKEIIFKRYNQKKRIDPFKDFFRPSRAFKARKVGNALFYSGLPVALPIGAFEERRFGWVRHSYFVMEKLNAKRLNEFLQEEFGHTKASGRSLTGGEIRKKRKVLGALARLVRRLHNQGFANRDLKPTNIFVSEGPEENLAFYIIDYDAYTLKRRVSARRRLCDLSRMELAAPKLRVLSRTERMRFLREYLADIRPGKLEFKAWCRDILRRANRKRR